MENQDTCRDTARRQSAHQLSRTRKQSTARFKGQSPAVPLLSRPHQTHLRVNTTNNENGLFVKGSIGGVQTNFLVDTGSNSTIVTPEVYQKIPEFVRPDLEDVVSTMLLADRCQLPFVGKAAIMVQLGRTEVIHEVWIADIGLEWILGMHFMRRLECKLLIDKGRYQLILPEGSVACEHQQNESSCCRVVVGKTVLVPPGTEMMVPGKYVHPVGVTGPGVLEVTAKFAD